MWVLFTDEHLLVTADNKWGRLHRREIPVYFECIDFRAEAMAMLCYMLCLETIAAHSTEGNRVTHIAERPTCTDSVVHQGSCGSVAWVKSDYHGRGSILELS